MRAAICALALLCAPALARAEHVAVSEGEVKGAPAPFPEAAWDKLVSAHVDEEGRVRYAAVDRAALDKLVVALAASSPRSHGDMYKGTAAKLAYYLAAYQIAVWRSVVGKLPKLEPVDDGKGTFFRDTTFQIGAERLSLQQLDEAMMKELKDARVHLALARAAIGGPRHARRAFDRGHVDAQLTEAAKAFVAEKRNVDHDPAHKLVKLSRIFEWYGPDFGGNPRALLGWINRFRAPAAKLPLGAKIEFVPYDRSLDDASTKR